LECKNDEGIESKKVNIIQISKYRLLLASSFKKILIRYERTVVEELKATKDIYSEVPLNLQLLLYIFKIKYVDKASDFTKRDITENGEPSIFYGEVSRKYDCFIDEEMTKINGESYKKSIKLNKEQLLVNLKDFDYHYLVLLLL